ncbi:hypothetical protein [Terasakiella pusilla]|uniref:hypothetical protein n=1 Tax=Terasakiella pusilla TaxID=64973 RepID=UPI000490012B|nr:hypothetical protein [Terasakiella pusilla]
MNLEQKKDRIRMTPKALKAFIKLMNVWKVETVDRQRLIGDVPNFDFENYIQEADTPIEPLPKEQIELIFSLLNIAKYLRTLFSKPVADDWINRLNCGPLLVGKTALEYMCENGPTGIREIQRELAARIYG